MSVDFQFEQPQEVLERQRYSAAHPGVWQLYTAGKHEIAARMTALEVRGHGQWLAVQLPVIDGPGFFVSAAGKRAQGSYDPTEHPSQHDPMIPERLPPQIPARCARRFGARPQRASIDLQAHASLRECAIHGLGMDALVFIGAVAVWVGLQYWLLPRLGVST